MEYLEFVCHAPSDFYKKRLPKVPELHKEDFDTGFIWTNIGPKVCKIPTTSEIFGTVLPPEQFAELCEPGKLTQTPHE